MKSRDEATQVVENRDSTATIDISAAFIKKVQKNPRRHFHSLCARVFDRIWYAALSYTRNEPDAQDLTQDICLRLYQNIANLKEPKAFNVWLGTIIQTTAYNFLKERSRRSERDITLSDDATALQADLAVMSTQMQVLLADSQQVFEGMESRDILHSLIANLPESQREVINLYYFQSCSIREMALMLDLPESTVTSRLHRGRSTLLKRINEYNEEAEVSLMSKDFVNLASFFSVAFPEKEVHASKKIQEEVWRALIKETKAMPDVKSLPHFPFRNPTLINSTIAGVLVIGSIAVVGAFLSFLGDVAPPETPSVNSEVFNVDSVATSDLEESSTATDVASSEAEAQADLSADSVSAQIGDAASGRGANPTQNPTPPALVADEAVMPDMVLSARVIGRGDRLRYGSYGGTTLIWRVVAVTNERVYLLPLQSIGSSTYTALSANFGTLNSAIILFPAGAFISLRLPTLINRATYNWRAADLSGAEKWWLADAPSGGSAPLVDNYGSITYELATTQAGIRPLLEVNKAKVNYESSRLYWRLLV